MEPSNFDEVDTFCFYHQNTLRIRIRGKSTNGGKDEIRDEGKKREMHGAVMVVNLNCDTYGKHVTT